MVRRHIELQCDECGNAEHFSPGSWQETAREYGWVLTKGKHFCSKKCRANYIAVIRAGGTTNK